MLHDYTLFQLIVGYCCLFVKCHNSDKFFFLLLIISYLLPFLNFMLQGFSFVDGMKYVGNVNKK